MAGRTAIRGVPPPNFPDGEKDPPQKVTAANDGDIWGERPQSRFFQRGSGRKRFEGAKSYPQKGRRRREEEERKRRRGEGERGGEGRRKTKSYMQSRLLPCASCILIIFDLAQQGSFCIWLGAMTNAARD